MAKATKTVTLKKGAVFSLLTTEKDHNGNFVRKRIVGPAKVEMTDKQISAFKDLLDNAPAVKEAPKPAPSPEPEASPAPSSEAKAEANTPSGVGTAAGGGGTGGKG